MIIRVRTLQNIIRMMDIRALRSKYDPSRFFVRNSLHQQFEHTANFVLANKLGEIP